MNRRRLFILFAVAGLCIGAWRALEPMAHSADRPAGLALCEAALATHAAWVRDCNEKNRTASGAIPHRFWTDEIRALRPIKVYSHRANIVVVQRVCRRVERGKYITLLISSYIPVSGDDGFTFLPQSDDGVFDYRRPLTERR